jgi:hypothetical protein
MRGVVVFLGIAAALGSAASQATESPVLGYCDEGDVLGPITDTCDGELIVNHDGSFENGACWQYGGVLPPYYGAFGEGFELGDVHLECMAIWVTQIGEWADQTMDLYVWDGGVTREPGSVLALFTDRRMYNVPMWPDAGQNDFELCVDCNGEFTVGYWAHFADCPCGWFTVADFDDSPGHAWTCIAPGIGYPSGWQHPSVVWYDPFSSLGFGVYAQDSPSPPRSRTWGSIRVLFE